MRLANLTLYTIVRRICHTRTAPVTARRRSAAGSQAALAPLSPTRPRKNLYVCVLNLTGSVAGHGAFTNPQVDDLHDFKLLPLAELKRKHASFFRAGRPKGARNPPSRARMLALRAALPSARNIRPTVPRAPAASIPPYQGDCGQSNATTSRFYGFPRSTPEARYRFGATLLSSQTHRKAKATRTRAPPA